MLLSAPRQIEGETKYAVHSCSGEDCLLNYCFLFCSFIDPATDVGVFSLIIFADDGEVDVGGFPVFEWGFDSFEQPDRPQVDVLLKGAANRNQHSPKRDMIRHVGASDCPKIYRVKFTKLAEAIAWHHLA